MEHYLEAALPSFVRDSASHTRFFLGLVVTLLATIGPIAAQSVGPDSASNVPPSGYMPCGVDAGCLVLEDFESFEDGGLPFGWFTYRDRRDVKPVTGALMNDEERFVIVREGNNQFIRALVYDQAHRLVLPNEDPMDWELAERPILSWDWRAHVLPVGAREDVSKLNDTGAAVYVIFDRDWLGRPRGIKYSFSSTLPAGSRASYAALRVLVVSSQGEDGLGGWVSIRRNVADDYRSLFGKNPPRRPSAIFLWSDSDSVDGAAEVDFDNLRLARDSDQ